MNIGKIRLKIRLRYIEQRGIIDMNKGKFSKTIAVWLLGLWMLSFAQYNLILSYSSAPAAKSAAESGSVSKKITKALDYVFKSKKFSTNKKLVSKIHRFIRKVAHFVIYFILGFLMIMFFYIASGNDIRKALVVTLFVCMAGAALDEMSQLFVEGRSGQIKDVILDFCGVCGGCLLFTDRLLKLKKKIEGVIL